MVLEGDTSVTRKERLWPPPKRLLLTIGALVAALLLLVISGHRLLLARYHYVGALADLKSHHWESAKFKFTLAKREGMFVYSDGDQIYGLTMLTLAKQALRDGKFNDANRFLSMIPPRSKAFTSSAMVRAMNPLNVDIGKYVPPHIKVTRKMCLMLAPDVPAICAFYEGSVNSNRSSDLGNEGIFLIVFDPRSSCYKVNLNVEGESETFEAFYGHLFGDKRNALVITGRHGSGGYLDVGVYGVDSSTHKLEKFLDLSSLYEGGAEIRDGNKLLVSDGGKLTLYRWDGSEFVGQRITSQPPIGTNDVVVHYEVAPGGTILADSDWVQLREGQKLVLIRDDQSSEGCKILYDDSILTSVGNVFDEFIAKNAGDGSISIMGGAEPFLITVSVISR